MSEYSPLLVLEIIRLRPTLEHPRPTSCILKHWLCSLNVRFLHLHNLIRTHPQKLLPNVVEAV